MTRKQTVPPYYTRALLLALTDCAQGKEVSRELRETLRSRGWIDQRGVITPSGLVRLGSHS